LATQICPNCKEDSFTWSFDEEDSPLTFWGCSCGYHAYEDEALQRECSTCGEKSECQMEDDHKKYWWCFRCNKVTLISEK
jgi:hypothetical protein